MLNSSDTNRLYLIILVLSGGVGLVGLMILFPGPYIFVLVALGVLLLGIGFIRSVSDQDRIERKYLLRQLVSHSDLLIEDNDYRRAIGQYENRQAQFDLISRSNSEWDVYDMQLMVAIENKQAFNIMLRERETKNKAEDDKFISRFKIQCTPAFLHDTLFTKATWRKSLLQVDHGIELVVQDNFIWLKQHLNEDIEYILHLFNLLCQVAEKIEKINTNS